MCSNETCSKFHTGKHLSDMFPIQNGLKPGDSLSPLLFYFSLEYTLRKVQENQARMTLTKAHQLLVYSYIVTLLGDNVNTERKTQKL
jgi:hypothetical protein